MIKEDCPKYLIENENELDRIDNTKQDKGTGALIKIKCRHMEEDNKYWLKLEDRICVFSVDKGSITSTFVSECSIIKEWFHSLVNKKE